MNEQNERVYCSIERMIVNNGNSELFIQTQYNGRRDLQWNRVVHCHCNVNGEWDYGTRCFYTQYYVRKKWPLSKDVEWYLLQRFQWLHHYPEVTKPHINQLIRIITRLNWTLMIGELDHRGNIWKIQTYSLFPSRMSAIQVEEKESDDS